MLAPVVRMWPFRIGPSSKAAPSSTGYRHSSNRKHKYLIGLDYSAKRHSSAIFQNQIVRRSRYKIRIHIKKNCSGGPVLCYRSRYSCVSSSNRRRLDKWFPVLAPQEATYHLFAFMINPLWVEWGSTQEVFFSLYFIRWIVLNGRECW